LTLGDLVAGCYRAWGKRKAEGMIGSPLSPILSSFAGGNDS